MASASSSTYIDCIGFGNDFIVTATADGKKLNVSFSGKGAEDAAEQLVPFLRNILGSAYNGVNQENRLNPVFTLSVTASTVIENINSAMLSVRSGAENFGNLEAAIAQVNVPTR